jgi:hypothetical protein
LSFLPAFDQEVVERFQEGGFAALDDFWWNAILAGGLAAFQGVDGLAEFFYGGLFVQVNQDGEVWAVV